MKFHKNLSTGNLNYFMKIDRLACITRLAIITCFVNTSNKMKHKTL
jgi:hypothetical protein